MASTNELYNVLFKIQDFKNEIINQTRGFVDKSYPSYFEFINKLKEKCKTAPVQNVQEPEKKTTLEKLFGKKKADTPAKPSLCYDEKTFDFIANSIKDWHNANFYKIEFNRDSMIEDLIQKLNDLEDSVDNLIKISTKEKRLESLKGKDKKETEREISSTTPVPPTESPKEKYEEEELRLKNAIKEIREKVVGYISKIENDKSREYALNEINDPKNIVCMEEKFKDYYLKNLTDSFYKRLEAGIAEYNGNPLFTTLQTILYKDLNLRKCKI